MAQEKINTGQVVQVIGPVVDVQFEAGSLPAIYSAVRIISEGFKLTEPLDIVTEVQQHLGEGRVRCVAMKPTEGVVRGMKAIDLGGPITVPVGRATLGRVTNVLGRIWVVTWNKEHLRGGAPLWDAIQERILPTGWVDNKILSFGDECYGTQYVLRVERR